MLTILPCYVEARTIVRQAVTETSYLQPNERED